MLLGAPGLATRNKKLVGAKGISTRIKDATRGMVPGRSVCPGLVSPPNSFSARAENEFGGHRKGIPL